MFLFIGHFYNPLTSSISWNNETFKSKLSFPSGSCCKSCSVNVEIIGGSGTTKILGFVENCYIQNDFSAKSVRIYKKQKTSFSIIFREDASLNSELFY